MTIVFESKLCAQAQLESSLHTRIVSMKQSENHAPLLSTIDSPRDLRRISPTQLDALAAEIRAKLIEDVSKTGGHLGPNLGVVELTIALHRVFRSPSDTIVFDTGHQTYVHKLLTGRQDFSKLRQEGGISGYPSRAESSHDVVENSHASSSLSWVDGISREKERRGDPTWTIGVIGDGALTGGMAWEALNNIASDPSRRVIVIVNDNGRSYAPTIGAFARHLDLLRSSQNYEKALSWGKRTLMNFGEPGRATYGALHGLKSGLKDTLIPQAMFEDLGLKYLGPVNGHDISAMEEIFRRASELNEPVLIHVMTQKGRGYTPAEEDIADRFHAVGKIHPETGLPIAPARFAWTSVFADEIRRLAHERDDIVGVTAAMMLPVGLGPFKEDFPNRVVDVGIAEQHAVASAAGMAFAGAHPVFAVYATFLNRAFDQVLMDVGLHRCGVTFILDRAGITGDDGASHNGMWDIAMLNSVPGLRLAAPRDEATLRDELREAVAVDDAPTVLRYPKGALVEPIVQLRREGVCDVLKDWDDESTLPKVAIVALGSMVPAALGAAEKLEVSGEATVRVIDPRWALPVPSELVSLTCGASIVVSVEDGLIDGGFGWSLRDLLSNEAKPQNLRVITAGIPKEFLGQASRASIVASLGLDEEGLASRICSELR